MPCFAVRAIRRHRLDDFHWLLLSVFLGRVVAIGAYVCRRGLLLQTECVVCRSVCWSVTVASPAKTAEPIEMPFGLRTRVAQRSIEWIRIQIHVKRGNFEGEVRPIVKYRDALQ